MWLKRPKIEAVSSELLSVGETIYYKNANSKYQVGVQNVDVNTQAVTLVINNVTPKDAGKYACSAQILGMEFNDYPSSEVKVVVKQKVQPKPKTCKCDTTACPKMFYSSISCRNPRKCVN
jgi:hypothetical protein